MTTAAQVTAETPELLKRNDDGTLKHPCPRAALPVQYVDAATGRPTTSWGEALRFGQESDAFISVCESRVALGGFTIDTIRAQALAAQQALTKRSWWQRVTPWRE